MATIYIEYSNPNYTKVGETDRTLEERHNEHVQEGGYSYTDVNGNEQSFIDYTKSQYEALGDANEAGFHAYLRQQGAQEAEITQQDGTKVEEIFAASATTVKKLWEDYQRDRERTKNISAGINRLYP